MLSSSRLTRSSSYSIWSYSLMAMTNLRESETRSVREREVERVGVGRT